MKTLLPLVLGLILYSCSVDSTKLEQLESRQLQLEQRIDSLETALKTLERYTASTDSILLEMVQPQQGSLLHELEKD